MQYQKIKTLTMLIALAAGLTFAGEAAFAQQNSKEDAKDQFVATERAARPVNGRGIVVDDDNRCPGIDFTSVQAAINASPAGSTIQVCPGVYREQLRITKNITLVGVEFENQAQARIEPAAAVANSTSLFDGSAIAALVLVDGASRVTLENLTVDGASSRNNACSPALVGVFYRNSSGAVESAAVRNIIAGGASACQNGVGIFAQSGGGRRANLAVSNTSVHDYDKTGIAANELGTTLNASGNAISGRGAVQDTAQNGIQIGFGASGQIEENSVINNVYALCTSTQNCSAAAVNILVIDADEVRVRGNTAGKSQVNILMQGNRNDANSNTVFDADVFDNIVLSGDGNDARGNRVFNSDRAGITVSGSQNRVRNNTINEAQIGIFIAAGSDNNIGNNGFFNTVVNSTSASGNGNNDAARSASGNAAAEVRPSAVRF